MTDGALFWPVLLATLGSAVMSGIFFAFSVFVMQALRRLPAPQGIAAMQSINVTIVTPLFVLALGGTAFACVVLALASAVRLDEPDAPLVLAASLSYLVGCMFVTIAYHVPRNQALDNLDPGQRSSADYWERFVPRWVAVNHVRTIASVAATTCFVLSLA